MSASKVIYVSEDPNNLVQHAAIDIVGPKRLDELLEEGWYITKDEKTKVHHPTAGKRLTVRRILLSNERGVATTAREGTPGPVDAGVNALTTAIASLVGRQQGLPGETGNSYLGKSIVGSVPGVKTVTQFAGQGAFGMGADSAKSGQVEDACPFPEGSIPFAEWLSGYLQAHGRANPETALAIQEGRQAAQGPKDAEVTCRFVRNTRQYVGWVYGFKIGGGTVEAQQ